MTWLVAYVVSGTLIGFLAGLLGIGGGMTIVPILAYLYSAQHFAPDHVVHLSLATAMASIIFTSTASVREHNKRGAVDWAIVKRMAPGMLLGTLAATLASGWVPQQHMALAFAVVVYAASVQMALGKKPKAARPLPGAVPLFIIGVLIGIAAGLVSAGGAFLSMPFMVFCGVPMIVAIGTGAAIGVPIAIVGSIGYIIAGWNVPGLPPYSLGFIYLPALAAIVCGSVLTAPYGARMAHRLPVTSLKRGFALLLFVIATKMLLSYW